ncbi:MAG: hypothetical protein R3B72_01795 [Polyangiaceae bacterium]
MSTPRLLRSVILALLVVGGCLGSIRVGEEGDGGQGGTGAPGTGGSGGMAGGGGDDTCYTPPNGICSVASDCDCVACQPAAACKDGGCLTNLLCDLFFEDTCICSDCDTVCHDQCLDDGVCDTSYEGCACSDCFGEETCLDNQVICQGGVPDGICDPVVESCGCNDCLGAPECMCDTDGTCTAADFCVCPDCDGVCDCFEDGICEPYNEGCDCADCASHPLCS